MHQTSLSLQSMLLILQRYQLNVGYVPRKPMYMTNTLPRAHSHRGKQQEDDDFDDELEIMVQSTLADIPVKATDWIKIQQASEYDSSLRIEMLFLMDGQIMSTLQSDLQPYW